MNNAGKLNIDWKWWPPAPTQLAGFRAAIKKAWIDTFGEKCLDCNRTMIFDRRYHAHSTYATVDHIIARCNGGTNDLDNIRIICRRCNDKKGKLEDPNRPPSKKRNLNNW